MERKPEDAEKAEQRRAAVTKLRQIDVLVAEGRTVAQACKEAELSEQSYYRWRKEYGGLDIEQAKRFKELERADAGKAVGQRQRQGRGGVCKAGRGGEPIGPGDIDSDRRWHMGSGMARGMPK